MMGLPLVDDTGIEPVTPTMSMWCSTAEPIVQVSSALGLTVVTEFPKNERILHPTEVIFDTDDVVFTEVGARLDLNE